MGTSSSPQLVGSGLPQRGLELLKRDLPEFENAVQGPVGDALLRHRDACGATYPVDLPGVGLMAARGSVAGDKPEPLQRVLDFA